MKVVLRLLSPILLDYSSLYRLALVECELVSLQGLPSLPQLVSLDLSANLLSQHTHLVPLNNNYHSLIDLNLMRNQLESIHDIQNLAIYCPGLKILNLSSNKIC